MGFRSRACTFAPRDAKMRAAAKPIPEHPPVVGFFLLIDYFWYFLSPSSSTQKRTPEKDLALPRLENFGEKGRLEKKVLFPHSYLL